MKGISLIVLSYQRRWRALLLNGELTEWLTNWLRKHRFYHSGNETKQKLVFLNSQHNLIPTEMILPLIEWLTDKESYDKEKRWNDFLLIFFRINISREEDERTASTRSRSHGSAWQPRSSLSGQFRSHITSQISQRILITQKWQGKPFSGLVLKNFNVIERQQFAANCLSRDKDSAASITKKIFDDTVKKPHSCVKYNTWMQSTPRNVTIMNFTSRYFSWSWSCC